MYCLGTECMHNQLFFTFQRKALCLIRFKEHKANTAPLFFKAKKVKLPDKIKIENCLLISSYVNNKLPPIFNCSFIFFSNSNNYETTFVTVVAQCRSGVILIYGL